MCKFIIIFQFVVAVLIIFILIFWSLVLMVKPFVCHFKVDYIEVLMVRFHHSSQ